MVGAVAVGILSGLANGFEGVPPRAPVMVPFGEPLGEPLRGPSRGGSPDSSVSSDSGGNTDGNTDGFSGGLADGVTRSGLVGVSDNSAEGNEGNEGWSEGSFVAAPQTDLPVDNSMTPSANRFVPTSPNRSPLGGGDKVPKTRDESPSSVAGSMAVDRIGTGAGGGDGTGILSEGAMMAVDAESPWKQFVDDASGVGYWFNEASGESSWSKPVDA